MKPPSPSPISRAAALLLLTLTFPAAAQTAPGDRGGLPQAGAPSPSTDIPSLIQQLGSPYVRLRDEAEAKLKDLPDAQAPLRALVQSAPASEAGLRAAHVLDLLKHSEWTLTADLQLPGSGAENDASVGNPKFLVLRALCPAPDTSRLVAMYRAGAAIITLNPLVFVKATGQPGARNSQNWQGVRRAVAVSPDGKWIASGNDRGEILLNDFQGNLVRKITLSATSSTPEALAAPSLPEPGSGSEPLSISGNADTFRLTLDDPPGAKPTVSNRRPSLSLTDQATIAKPPSDTDVVWGLAFSPDNNRLLILNGADGLTLHDLRTAERQSLAFPEMRPRCLALSADGQYAAIGADPDRRTCRLFLVRLRDLSTVLDTTLKTIPNAVSLNPDGSRVLVAIDNGGIISLDRDGENRRILHQFSGPATSVSFSADGKKILATSLDPQSPLVLLNADNGSVEWAAPAAAQGNHSTVWIDPQHFASSSNDGRISVWSRRGAPALPTASKPE